MLFLFGRQVDKDAEGRRNAIEIDDSDDGLVSEGTKKRRMLRQCKIDATAF